MSYCETATYSIRLFDLSRPLKSTTISPANKTKTYQTSKYETERLNQCLGGWIITMLYHMLWSSSEQTGLADGVEQSAMIHCHSIRHDSWRESWQFSEYIANAHNTVGNTLRTPLCTILWREKPTMPLNVPAYSDAVQKQNALQTTYRAPRSEPKLICKIQPSCKGQKHWSTGLPACVGVSLGVVQASHSKVRWVIYVDWRRNQTT
jgi:hypothetical protein